MARAKALGGDDGGELLEGLPPILDARVETLILGSFPSPASIAARHYYAHPQNQFWRVLEAVFGEPLVASDYGAKRCALLAHRIGVWDVYRTCRREGALDSAIRAGAANDFSILRTAAPRLRRVCFNGQTSGRFERALRELGYETCVLPSTSPAYTLAFAEKLVRWRAALLEPAAR